MLIMLLGGGGSAFAELPHDGVVWCGEEKKEVEEAFCFFRP